MGLHHWISITSLNRLLGQNLDQMPLKILGTDQYVSVLSHNAPVFKDRPGLYMWHNPLANVGGSGEIYGNTEALLMAQLESKLRIGLVVTSSDTNTAAKVTDPKAYENYDLVLHVNGDVYNGEFTAGLIEWVLLNPKAIKQISVDPKESIRVMETYRKALNELEKSGVQIKTSLIDHLAGPQHSPMPAMAINAERVKRLEKSLLKHREQLKAWIEHPWIIFHSSGSIQFSSFHN